MNGLVRALYKPVQRLNFGGLAYKSGSDQALWHCQQTSTLWASLWTPDRFT